MNEIIELNRTILKAAPIIIGQSDWPTLIIGCAMAFGLLLGYWSAVFYLIDRFEAKLDGRK